MTEDRLLDAREAAELLNVPIGWVRGHTQSGDLPHVQLGRYRRYRREELLAFIEQQSSGGDRGSRRRPLRVA